MKLQEKQLRKMPFSFAALAVLIIAVMLGRSEVRGDALYYFVGAFFVLAFLQQGLP